MVQYSDYRRPDSHLAEVWTVMVGLGQLPPLGKIQSTLRRLKMHHIHNLDVMDKTSANYGLSAQYCTESVVVHSACSGCRDVYDFHRSTRVLLQCYHRLHAGF
jgi:hypothetical protein